MTEMSSRLASASRSRGGPVLAGAATLDVICAGEALWDLAPSESASLRFKAGGGAANTAVMLARAGLRVGLAATLGDDASGRALLARIAAAGVEVGGVILASPQGGLLVLEDAGGALVETRLDASAAIAVPDGWGASLLLLSGISPELAPMAGLCRAARAARRAGTMVVVDLNVRWRSWAGRDPRTLHALLREADVVRASVADLFGLRLDGAALHAAMRPTATLVLTQGAGLARASGPFGEVTSAPVAVAKTRVAGAGDAFTSALCVELVRAGDAAASRSEIWKRALERAHAAARQRIVG